jgi:hypothetical protein
MKSIIFWDVTPCSLLFCVPPAYLLVLSEKFFDPEDGGDMFLRNVRCISTDYTASHSRRWYSRWLVLHITSCIYLKLQRQVVLFQSSPVQQIATGPRQHSCSWFRATSESMTIFLFHIFKWGLLFDKIGVWLLLVTPPPLGSDSTGSHSHPLNHSHYCCTRQRMIHERWKWRGGVK